MKVEAGNPYQSLTANEMRIGFTLYFGVKQPIGWLFGLQKILPATKCNIYTVNTPLCKEPLQCQLLMEKYTQKDPLLVSPFSLYPCLCAVCSTFDNFVVGLFADGAFRQSM